MARIRDTDPDAVVAVLTADHVITPLEELVAAFEAGFALAGEGALVTFGVVPDHAATGFGWLQLGVAVGPAGAARQVSGFTEKPERAAAEQMLAAGSDRFLWNSGMFVWRAERLLEAAERFAPKHAAAGVDPSDARWDSLPPLSVDRGVMEPAAQEGSGFAVAAVPLTADWRDVGSWSSYAAVVGTDGQGNAVSGRSILLDSADCVVASDDPTHLIALLGVRDLVVVHTAGATLVCRAEDAQRVKELQRLVAEQAPDRA
jgi:mannose-1-phosphate guanylyltransferase